MTGLDLLSQISQNKADVVESLLNGLSHWKLKGFLFKI